MVYSCFEAQAFADYVSCGERKDGRGEERGVEQAEGEEVGGEASGEGTRAAAAWAASVMLVMPFLFRVAAQQMMMKKTITMQEMLPTRDVETCVFVLFGADAFFNETSLEIEKLPRGDGGAD